MIVNFIKRQCGIWRRSAAEWFTDILPFFIKRLDVSMSQQGFPSAILSSTACCQKAYPIPFRRFPRLLEILNKEAPNKSDVSIHLHTKILWLDLVVFECFEPFFKDLLPIILIRAGCEKFSKKAQISSLLCMTLPRATSPYVQSSVYTSISSNQRNYPILTLGLFFIFMSNMHLRDWRILQKAYKSRQGLQIICTHFPQKCRSYC